MYKIYGECYLPDEDPIHECCDCECKDKKIEEMKNWITYLMEEFYSRNPISEMHRYLEELCHVAEVTMPSTPSTLARIPKQSYVEPISEVERICNEWISFNNQYLNNINH
jgi:hypothetical protein